MGNRNHPDEVWQKRKFGAYHTSNGRQLPRRLAALSRSEQEKNLQKFDKPEYQMHSDSMKFDPVESVQRGAGQYTQARGMADPHQFGYHDVQTNKNYTRAMGRAYEAAPEHQESAIPHYRALRDEVNSQFDHLTKNMGVHVEATDHDPYKNVHEMVHDLRNNNRLKVLSTKITGGHPFFSDETNDAFRAVHDAFGHAATGRGFDAHGEEGAYAAHSRMFSAKALPAMQSETRAQNAYLHLNGDFSHQKLAVLPRHLQALPVIGGRSTSQHLHVASIEDLLRHEQGSQHVSDVTSQGRTYPLCQRHIRSAHERGDLVGQIARSTGLRDETEPEQRLSISAPYKGTCAQCDQEQRRNNFKPWDANKSMYEQSELSDVRPSKPSTRGLYPNPGSWPYNQNKQTKEFSPMPSQHMSQRIAIRKSFSHDPDATGLKAFAARVSAGMPDVVAVPMPKHAHDSGDHETVFHCPFDGSGNVIANSDGTISCSFCNAGFNVVVQPTYPSFPQTVNGAPVNVPMGPDWSNNVGVTPSEVPAEDQPQDPTADPQEPDTADQQPPFAKQSLFTTASGAKLDLEAYKKHLALQTSKDFPATLERIRRMNAGK